MLGIAETLKAAGMTATDFAPLCNVTRGMVYKWIRGVQPHELRRPRIEKLLVAIKLAVESKELPISKEKSPRPERIKAVVVAHLRKTT